MQTPYEILGVDENATDAEIKEAYLRGVKQHPPERDPARFEQLHQAYDTVKDIKSRISHALFSRPSADFDALLDRAFSGGPPAPLSASDFQALLRAGVNDTALWNTIPHTGNP